MRKEILGFLQNEMGSYVSGEMIAKKLNITRTAIWKNISVLKGMGYNITSRRKRGYCLTGVPDLLYPLTLNRRLDTDFIGQSLLYHNQIVSTQLEARKLICQGEVPEGLLILSERQESGIGRHGRRWESPKGGLWFSFVLKPAISPEDTIKVTLVAALSIVRVIRKKTSVPVKVKWPNDIVIERSGRLKKLCGILTEMCAEPGIVHWVVVGIGINVNNSLPASLAGSAVSLKALAGKKIDRIEFLESILREIEKNYAVLKRGQFSSLMKDMRKYSAILGKKIKIRLADEEITGCADSLDDEGALMLRQGGRLRRLVSGEIIKVERG